MPETPWDVVVIGAGAAGLLAASRAAERGRRTLVLEKNKRPGIKILMSGGTRCNLTHDVDNRGIVEAFGPPGKFLHSALAALGVQDTIDLFEAEGVATKVEETGKVFPVSNKAGDVLEALLRRLRRGGAILALGEPVHDVCRSDGGLTLTTAQRTIEARRVVLTTGGQSYPGSGTCGDGYAFAARLGHAIVPPRPALVPLTVGVPWVAELRGVTLPDCTLRIVERADGGPRLADRALKDQQTHSIRNSRGNLPSRRGSLLFAHFGLSGPAALDVSRAVSACADPQALAVELDLLPAQTEAELDETMRQESLAQGKKLLVGILPEALPRRLGETLLALAGMAIDRRAAALSKVDRTRLVRLIKQLVVPLTGTLGFKKAEVTAGGISLDEVDSRSMQSKRVPELLVAGEVLDLDGPIGGYNFQAAFSTGWLAGESA